MSGLSKMQILDKVFIYSGVVASQSNLLSLPFGKTKPLYLLLSVRALANRYKAVNDYALMVFMRANKHTTSWQDLYKTLDLLTERNYIIRSGKTNQCIYLTVAGDAAINLLESTLRKSHFKFRRDGTHKVKVIPKNKRVSIKLK